MANFQSLEAAKLVAKWDDVVPLPVGKTIMIGLGGTGKDVLLRFRRLIVEKFGSLDRLPCIQFLHMDTDQTTTAKEQYDMTSQSDALYEKIKFQPPEMINLTIDGDCSKYLANIKVYPHIQRWFQTKGRIMALGNLGKGAGQVRMASRLAFYTKYTEIQAAIKRADMLLGDHTINEKLISAGFNFDPALMNIYVVASLAGGTGSGTFLDTAFLLKAMFSDANVNRIGVFFLPSFFSGYAGKPRMNANGYAALKELNYYSFGHIFEGYWSKGQQHFLYPPPFDITYLLEGKNEVNQMIGSSSKEFSMYQMVAETFFQEFSLGEFAGMVRSVGVNLKQYIDNAYVHNYWVDSGDTGTYTDDSAIKGDSYTTRFCSFGLSTIYFPTAKVQKACACRVAQTILENWQQDVVTEPLDILFTSFLSQSDIKFVQGKYSPRSGGGYIDNHDVEEALLAYQADSGVTFQAYIWNKICEWRREEERVKNGQKVATLEDFRQQWEIALAKADSDNPDDWGTDIRILENNKNTYLAALKKNIEERTNKLANESRYGISYALSLLRELKKLLVRDDFDYLKYFGEKVTEWAEYTQYYLNQLEQLQMEVGLHERELLFRKADIQRDIHLLAPNTNEGDGVLYHYYLSRVMKQVAKRGKQICEAIDEFLGDDTAAGKGLLGKYHKLSGGFSVLRERLKKKETYYSRNESYASLKSLYMEGDIDKWYAKWLGDKAHEKENIKQLSGNLLSTVFGVNTVIEALTYIQQHPQAEVEDKMVEECSKLFERHSEQPSALEMLLSDDRRLSPAQRNAYIESAYRRAKVWLKPTNEVNQVDFKVVNDQKPCFIGVCTDENLLFNNFKNSVTTIMGPGDSLPQFKNIGDRNKGMIVFYNELGGATAFYPSSVTEVGGLRQCYLDFIRDPGATSSDDNQEDVHIDKNRFKFIDIIPKTQEEVSRYTESVKAFVLARLLGVLKVDELKGDDPDTIINHYNYEYIKDEIREISEVSMGDEFSAVDMLYEDKKPASQTHRKKLFDQAEAVIEQLQQRKLLSVYLLLLEFFRNYVYPPESDISAAGRKVKQVSSFYAELDAESHRVVTQLIRGKEELARVKTALMELRKKPFGQKLSYDEYVQALSPYTKTAGKFLTTIKSVTEKRYFKDVLVIDKEKITGRSSAVKETVSKQQVVEDIKVFRPKKEVMPKRPCPECQNPIDIRAIYCGNCKKDIAAHIPCMHCGKNVPDDLAVCWSCGREAQPLKEEIECQRCYSFSGSLDEFPCKNCGWTPDEKAPGEKPSEEDFQIKQPEEKEEIQEDELQESESDWKDFGEKFFEEQPQGEGENEIHENSPSSAGLKIKCPDPECEMVNEPGSVLCKACGTKLQL